MLQLLCILSIIVSLGYSCLMCFCFLSAFYETYKKHKVHHIFEKVEDLYHYDYERSCWNYILDEIYLNKGLFRKYYKKRWFSYFKEIKPYFKEKLSNIVYVRAINSNLPFLNAYIYSFMQASHCFADYNEHHFNYDFFQYCEEKILRRLDSEQGYLHLCLNKTLKENSQFTDKDNRKYYKYNKCLACLCRELIFIEFPKYKFNYNRVVSYVEQACENIKNKYSDIEHELIEEMCVAYINTLSNEENFGLKSRSKNIYE